ncbi:hypothetical protein TH63_17930 [Rufibacter radiotolerans]|uniref:Lumazine-binding n=1 Tax=Rufibacter radiotolerans TaxID=1379910 RepID=A0A0H4VP65_9BACT|nr:hypothetical protein [Rufibacter radiotolerans]AKQ47093.1 hypothetical protein TH63_17930 [Rufibacter radiotolerans]
MRTTFTFLFFFLLTISANAQNKFLKDRAQTEQLSKKVAELFNSNKISESFQELSSYWPIPENELEGLEEKTIKYLNLLNERFGEPIGALKVRTESISDIALKETYLVRYQNSAIRLIFTYYKNSNGWIVNAFKWDDSFTDEFK